MTYADNIALDNVKNDMFIVMKPRRRITGFTLYSGSVYRSSCEFNPVVVEVSGTEYIENANTSLDAGKWYFDPVDRMLYVRLSDSTAPDSSDWVVATIELYVATKEVLWNRIPDDNTSSVVQFIGCVRATPSIRKSRTQQSLGFYPIETTSLVCANDPELFQEILWDASFNDAEIVIYHLCGSLKTENIEKLITARMGNFSFDDDQVTFNIYDASVTFDSEFNPPDATFKYYESGDGIDPDSAGSPVRVVFGRVFGIKPVNMEFKGDSPTNSDNRAWSVIAGKLSDYSYLDLTVTATDTGVHFFVDTNRAHFFTPGSANAADIFIVYDVNDGSESFGHRFSALNYATGEVTCTPTVSVAHLQVGSLCRKSPFKIQLIKGGVASYTLVYGRDYRLEDFSNGTFGFRLDSSCESNLGVSVFDPATDTFIVRVDGRGDTPTMNGSDFSENKQGYVTCFNGIVILYDIVKNIMGLSESEIDLDSFTDAFAEIDTELSFVYPPNGEDFGTYKDLIAEILSALCLCAEVNKDGKFSIKPISSIVSADDTVTSDDIRSGSWRYDVNYDDVGGVKFVDRKTEYSFQATNGGLYPPNGNDSTDKQIYFSNAALYLHKSRKYQTVFNLNTVPDNKILGMFSERNGRATIELNGQFFQREVNDAIEVDREKIPGFEYVKGTLRERNFRIVEIQKDLGRIVISLDDQKGIDDSGEF